MIKNTKALDALAERINAGHRAYLATTHRALKHAFDVGAALQEAKSGLPHGEWLPWLQVGCPDISERTAQRYMRIARRREELESKSATVADMTLRAAEEQLKPISLSDNPVHGSEDEKEALDRCLGRIAQSNFVLVYKMGRNLEENREACTRVGRSFDRYVSKEIGISPELAHKLIEASHLFDTMDNAITADAMPGIERIAPGAKVSPMGLDLPEDLSFEQWRAIGGVLRDLPGFNFYDLADLEM